MWIDMQSSQERNKSLVDTMAEFCSRSQPLHSLSMKWRDGEHLGLKAFGHHLLCLKGRQVFARRVASSVANAPWTHRSTTFASKSADVSDLRFLEGPAPSATPVSPDTEPRHSSDDVQTNVSGSSAPTIDVLPTIREPERGGVPYWVQNRVWVPIHPVDTLNSTGWVKLSTNLGIISSTYLQAFHVWHNTLIPLERVLSGLGCGVLHQRPLNRQVATDFSAADSDAASSSAKQRWCPPIDVTLFRELPKGARLRGGEDFSEITARAMSSSSGSVARVTRGTTETDEDTNVTHCYCRGILHNMIDYFTQDPDERICDGDPARRNATLALKTAWNGYFEFAPYGSRVDPCTETIPYGLWANASQSARVPEGTQNRTASYVTNSSSGLSSLPPPRLLLLLRNYSRILGNHRRVAEIASHIGFAVEVMLPENETLERQARAARYADVLVAVHGQALTWMVLMDAVHSHHCRTVVELHFYGNPLKNLANVYEVLAADNYLRYYRVPPTHADFLTNCSRGLCDEWRRTIRVTNRQIVHPAFHQQRLYTDEARVHGVLSRAFDILKTCRHANVSVPLSKGYRLTSQLVREPKQKKKK